MKVRADSETWPILSAVCRVRHRLPAEIAVEFPLFTPDCQQALRAIPFFDHTATIVRIKKRQQEPLDPGDQ